MTPDAALANLRELAVTVPTLGQGRQAQAPSDPETLRWLGRLVAIVQDQQLLTDLISLRVASDGLGGPLHDRNVNAIMQILHRALATVELQASPGARGAFVAVGNAADAFATIASIIQEAKHRVLIVDPYLDSRVVTDFIVAADAGVTINLLAGTGNVYPSLSPAVASFVTQYGSTRPLEARLASKGTLHDRYIIIDDTDVWDVSQSFKDFAKRSPAGVSRADKELATLKASHFVALWQASTPLA